MESVLPAKYPLCPQPSQPRKVSIILRTGPRLGVWKLAVLSGSKGKEGAAIHITGSDASNPCAWSPSLPLSCGNGERDEGSDWICSLEFGWLGCRGTGASHYTLWAELEPVLSAYSQRLLLYALLRSWDHPLEKLLQRGQRQNWSWFCHHLAVPWGLQDRAASLARGSELTQSLHPRCFPCYNLGWILDLQAQSFYGLEGQGQSDPGNPDEWADIYIYKWLI